MAKILRYITLVLFSALWFLGCNKSASKYLFDNNYVEDDYRFGDLYRLSNLKKFRKPIALLPKSTSRKSFEKTKYANIFLAGDSFTDEGRINEISFNCENYYRASIAKPNLPMPNRTGKDILVLETVERHLRERFAEPWKGWNVKANTPTKSTDGEIDWMNLKMPYNSEMQESILFSNNFVLNIREMKAYLTWKLFGRIDPKVKLSKDGNHLFYYLDIDEGVSSIYDKVSESEIENMVKNANITYDYYKSLGFKEVYLSVIPNKSSILENDKTGYNHLIERFENNKALKMPLISVIQNFQQKGATMYEIGDSHWSEAGKEYWLNKVNAELAKVK